jgi:cobaltochelatase CobN
MAAYLWVRARFRADAIVHFGTHGTQEWTPGKERGLSIVDYPNILVGDTPVIYPYIVDNVAEALHVKRRGRGVIVSHQTPPFAPAGLPEDLLVIRDRVRDYGLLDDGPVKRRTQDEILEHAARMRILDDLAWSGENARARFEEFQVELRTYLDDLSGRVQPLGLHTLGEPASDGHLTSTVMQMLGRPLYDALNLTPDEAAFAGDYRALRSTRAYQFVERHVMGDVPIDDAGSPMLKELASLGRDHLARLRDTSEMDAVLAALSGRFIRTSPGGDPIRNPEALPTGRNLYGFDPARVPTPSAYEAGRQALEELVIQYRNTHADRFPEKLTFSLWSTETMRHFGMLEAQIMAAIGVKPVWDRGGRVTGIEVVPATELARPRIDVVVSITGLYRDQFPNVMEWLNAGIARVAAVDEADNYVRRHTQAVRTTLAARDVAGELADEFSLTRIFGNESGDYGTKLPDAALASGSWEGDEDLATLYLGRMSWAYGPNPAHWSTKLTGRDGQEVNAYAEHLRGTSAAVFSRSSNLRGLLDTDHPFEYLGGISLAVRYLDGASPQLYVSNMRDPSRATLQTAERFLAADLRTTYQHPGWVAEMKKEGYAGTLALVNAVNNFWGWSAVDRNVVREDQWQAFHDIYVNDRYDLGLRDWFETTNPAALAGIAERMIEAVRKRHWNADARTIRELVRTYTDLSARHDLQRGNSQFQRFVSAQVRGFGLGGAPHPNAAGPHVQSPPLPGGRRPNPASGRVRGQQLLPSSMHPIVAQVAWAYGLLVVGMVLAGAFWQARKRTFNP